MTREELEKRYSHPKYADVREDLKRIMDARPDISDPRVIERAAEAINASRIDDVDLSVENALRLTANLDDPPSVEELVKSLNSMGINDGNILGIVEKGQKSALEELEEMSRKKPKKGIAERAEALSGLAEKLCEINRDIVLLGLPDISWPFAQLKIAFFTDSIGEEEQKLIYDMRLVSDSTKFYTENGVGFAIFYLKDILE